MSMALQLSDAVNGRAAERPGHKGSTLSPANQQLAYGQPAKAVSRPGPAIPQLGTRRISASP